MAGRRVIAGDRSDCHRRLQGYVETVSQIHEPATVDEAVGLLDSLGAESAPLAGGTWVMREAAGPAHYVSLRHLRPLRAIEAAAGEVRIGALATHTEIGAIEDGIGPLGALAEAARRSAFPAVRNVATLGGNLAARPFPEADLIPALLASEAVLELAGPDGRDRLDVAAYLADRDRRPPGELIASVSVPAPAGRRSWFERLTVRHAAEYSLASVAISLDVDAEGVITDARVAVGAVEDLPRRVEAAEALLRRNELRALDAAEAGRVAAGALRPRDALDAPGWYRRTVLPELFTRAGARLGAS